MLLALALSSLLPQAIPTGQPIAHFGKLHAPGRILVSGFDSDSVQRYRLRDQAPRGSAPVPGAQSIVQGPDGLLYVCAEKIDQVLRLDARTLEVLDAFVADDPLTPADENGPLDGPTAAVFGPDGDLYVASFENDRILRYDGTSGAYRGVFVTQALGGLNGPDAGTKFGPDGYLYVPSFFNDRILRYDGVSGAFVDQFIPFRSGGLRQPRDLVFHGDLWYVASSFNNRILRYDASGAFVDNLVSVNRPYSLAFHPHDNDLYVVSLGSNAVRVYDGSTGEVRGTAVSSGSAGLAGAVYLFLVP